MSDSLQGIVNITLQVSPSYCSLDVMSDSLLDPASNSRPYIIRGCRHYHEDMGNGTAGTHYLGNHLKCCLIHSLCAIDHSKQTPNPVTVPAYM